jgi:hypothetical protein
MNIDALLATIFAALLHADLERLGTLLDVIKGAVELAVLLSLIEVRQDRSGPD